MAKDKLGKSKIVVDIGTNRIKVMEIGYQGSKLKINKAYVIKDASKFSKDRDLTNLRLLTEVLIRSFKDNDIKTKTVSLVFTSRSESSKVIKQPISSFREMKMFAESTIEKDMEAKDAFSNIHDWGALGDVYDENETYSMFYTSTIPKIVVKSLVSEFSKQKYKVTSVDTYFSSMYHLSSLYDSAYEDPTKMFIDIGYSTSRTILVHRGVPVFTREFNLGIRDLIDTISNMVSFPYGKGEDYIRKIGLSKSYFTRETELLFDNIGLVEDDYIEAVDVALDKLLVEIKKNVAYCTNSPLKYDLNSLILLGGAPLLKGFTSKISELLNIKVDSWELLASLTGDNVTIYNNTDRNIDCSYGMVMGMALKDSVPSRKKINLLPKEDKNKHMVYSVIQGSVALVVLGVLFLGYHGAVLAKSYIDLNNVTKNNSEISRLRSSIENYKNMERQSLLQLQNLESIRFPFYEFTNFLIERLPDDVILISLDTSDILSASDPNVAKKKTITMTDPNNPSVTITVDENANIVDSSGSVIGSVDPSFLPSEFYVDPSTQQQQTTDVLQDIIIRGYSRDTSLIAKWFYELSTLPYVTSAGITAIEEKSIDNGARVNVFEFVLKFK